MVNIQSLIQEDIMSKKLILSALTLTTLLTAQQDTLHYGDVQAVVENPYSEGTNPTFPDQKGYIAGTNVYDDIGKYQRFELYNSNYVIGAVIYFGLKEIDTSGVPDTITVVLKDIENIASDSTDGVYTYGPAETNLATATLTLDEVDTSGVGNYVLFDTPVQMSGDAFYSNSFFIGIEWNLTAHLDTFALFSDSTGAELGDGENRAWERFNDGNFNDFGCVLSPNYCWGYDIDLWIGAVHAVEVASTDHDILLPETVKIFPAYPNPLNPSTTIRYEIIKDNHITVTIYDLNGTKIKSLINNYQPLGKHQVHWDGTSDDGNRLSSGAYFFRIQGDDYNQSRKILLLK